MRTGKHGRKGKTDSKESARREEKHSTRKAIGAWAEDTRMTFEGQMIWQRFAKKRSKSRKRSNRTVGKLTGLTQGSWVGPDW